VWRETTQSRHDGEDATFLYDESGSGVGREKRLVNLRGDAADDVWLVPAIPLQQSVKETPTDSQQRRNPNRRQLECRECTHNTAHRLLNFEDVPDDEWAGQPMWECQVCEIP
jgi:hypothetical protein